MRLLVLAVAVALLLVVGPLVASAESKSGPYFPPGSTIPPEYAKSGCFFCHNFYNGGDGGGPHGNYVTASNLCVECHTLHQGDIPKGVPNYHPAQSYKMLPAATVSASCLLCHDGTGGSGVYGTLAARGVAVAGGHRTTPPVTNVVPGGDAATGGPSTAVFHEANGDLTCSDCHTPHAANMIKPYWGARLANGQLNPAFADFRYSSRLLKQQPTSAETTVADYGSDWCAGCHKGRHSGTALHNHPVESVKTDPKAYTYGTAPATPPTSIGIATDSSGNVYVCDPGNGRVQKFTGAGVHLTTWTGGGTDPDYGMTYPPFQWPSGVAVHGDTMVVTDAAMANGYYTFSGGTFVGFESAFEFVTGIPARGASEVAIMPSPLYWPGERIFAAFPGTSQIGVSGDYGLGASTTSAKAKGLYSPMGVAVGPSDVNGGTVYIADTLNNRIQKYTAAFNSNLTPMTYVTSWGATGTAPAQFDHPGSVACDTAGNVYVADGMNNRIQKFTPAGAFVMQFGTKGSGPGQFKWPDGVAVDPSGIIFVVDRGNNRVQRFDASGNYTGKWGSLGTADGQFQFNGTFTANDAFDVGSPLGLGGSNAGYLMSQPRSTQQQGHAPLCQQCHENARNVGTLVDGVASPAYWAPAIDGVIPSGTVGPGYGNPRFQGFPHETANANMLVETKDDLCLNCHDPAQLP